MGPWPRIPRGGDCHQWCGSSQPLASPTYPARGLGPRYGASRTSFAGGSPPLQNMQVWRGFATGAKQNMGSIHKWDHKNFPHCNCRGASRIAILYSPNRYRSTLVNHHVRHANTGMALKLVHQLRYRCTHNCPATEPPSIPGLWTHSPIRVCYRLFRMRCTAAANSSRTFPFSLAPSKFTVPHVHVFAASLASVYRDWRRLRATTAGDLLVAATIASLIPYIPHIQTRITPCNP